MIALLPVGVAKASDEHLPESVDHSQANRLRQEGPVVIGPAQVMSF
jgi:hypothetical protein